MFNTIREQREQSRLNQKHNANKRKLGEQFQVREGDEVITYEVRNGDRYNYNIEDVSWGNDVIEISRCSVDNPTNNEERDKDNNESDLVKTIKRLTAVGFLVVAAGYGIYKWWTQGSSNEQETQAAETSDSQRASNLHAEGKQIWNQVWKEYERQEQYLDTDDYDQVTQEFKKALEKFQESHELVPDNNEYSLYYTMAKLKVEGNILFAEGLKLQQEGDQFRSTGDYSNALQKYHAAKEKFIQGAESDERFKECIRYSQNAIDVVHEYMGELDINTDQNEISLTGEHHYCIQDDATA